MPAYVVAQLDIHDPERFEEYRARVPDTVAAYGGHYLVRGGRYERLEGDWDPKRLTVIEFDSAEQARRWYESDEYRPLIELRQRAATTTLLIVEGV